MSKTRNFSDGEKRDAMDLLDIHDDINAVHLLTGINHRTLRRWRKKPRRRQDATLSEKNFSLSEKRTMSDEVLTNHQSDNNPAPALDPAIQPPANDNAAHADSNKANEGVVNTVDMTTSTLPFKTSVPSVSLFIKPPFAVAEGL